MPCFAKSGARITDAIGFVGSVGAVWFAALQFWPRDVYVVDEHCDECVEIVCVARHEFTPVFLQRALSFAVTVHLRARGLSPPPRLAIGWWKTSK